MNPKEMKMEKLEYHNITDSVAGSPEVGLFQALRDWVHRDYYLDIVHVIHTKIDRESYSPHTYSHVRALAFGVTLIIESSLYWGSLDNYYISLYDRGAEGKYNHLYSVTVHDLESVIEYIDDCRVSYAILGNAIFKS